MSIQKIMRLPSENELNRVRSILNILLQDPKIFPRLDIGNILTLGEFEQSYKDWIRLLVNLKNEHETTFFRPTWVPICSDKFVFIDVAQENWCIFGIGYNCWEDDEVDHYWYKNHFFIHMDDLLKNAGEFEYLKQVRNMNRDKRLNDIDEWLRNLTF